MRRIFLLSLLAISPVFAQPLKFDIADVHVSPTAKGAVQTFGGVLRNGRYLNRDVTMLSLIAAAYGVTEDTVSGGPGWISSDLFDVVAKVPDGTTMPKANQMLQSLLVERFKLVANQGTHPVPRYVLTVGKGGSKLKPAAGPEDKGCNPIGGGGPFNGNDPASIPNIKMACRGLTSASIANNLRQMAGGYFDHDIIDKTSLEGSWDFDLEWTPRGALAAKGADGISVFDAVSKQLGLKVEQQDVPQPGLVVESLMRKPTPTPPDVAKVLFVEPARFEAATIKPANPDAPQFQGLLYTGGSQMHAGGTLRFMIAMTMQLPFGAINDLVVGLPKSADTQRWDIIAKVPSTGEGAPNVVGGRAAPPPLSVGLEMLHGLLLEQFALKSHIENREVTVYALVLAGAKPKMTAADESVRSGCAPDPNAPKPVPNMGPMISCKNTSMAELADLVQRRSGRDIDHPVVDGTGLEGGWNFIMGWTPGNQLATPPPSSNANQPGGIVQSADPGGISVFEAMQKELGLKLVKQTKSIPVVVVDHVNEKPIE